MPRIWGARSLAPIYPDQRNLPEPVGEAWLTGPECKVESGPLTGSLHKAWQKMPPEWRGIEFKPEQTPREFPLLVKFLFPTDQLSIQVHPDDAYARDAELRGKIPMQKIAILVPLPPDASKKYLFSGEGGVSFPECVYCPNPQFSDAAKKSKRQGTVLLGAIITAEGSVTQVTVVKSLGSGLDERAIECVKEWRLRSAVDADGKPVSIPTPLEVVFRLNP